MSNKPLVFVKNCDYSNMDSAIDAVFSRFPLTLKDKLVWVKPNMIGDYLPQRQVTTHPAVIKAIVKKLQSKNARVVVGDNSGIQSILSDIATAKKSGILEASLGTFRNISESVIYRQPDLKFNDTIAISKIAAECDLMISVPKMKTHLHTLITGGIKNSYGMVVGIQKPKLHLKYPDHAEFSGLIGEIFNLRKPDLVIMDAVYAMEGDGPSSTDIRPVNKIIASYDAVALDHYMAKIMSMDPKRISLLNYCIERGFGSEEYGVLGDDTPVISDFKLPKTYHRKSSRNSFLESHIFKFASKKRVVVNRRKCIKCRKCYKVCPAKAISWKEFPVMDHSKCILCFCCKEVCDSDALIFAKKYVYADKALGFLNRLTGNK